MSLIEVMKNRHSWRDYSNKPIEHEKIERLKKSFTEIICPFANKPEFKIIELGEDEVKKFTTYGMIKGAKVFIGGKTAKADMCWTDFGYAMEYIILIATELGLGTCWLGGTLDRNESARKLELKENEVIPAITPVGYVTDKRSLRDNAVRFFAGSHKRKAWSLLFFDKNFNTPLSEDAGIYRDPLQLLRIAPSASNK